MGIKNWLNEFDYSLQVGMRKMMKCICSGKQGRVDDRVPSSESLATRDHSASGYSSRADEPETKVDNSSIEEAESSLRESGYLNYEEARALLGRLEYQKGNIEAALHVFEGIDVGAVTTKMRVSISRMSEHNRRHSQSDAAPPMSMHAVNLLLEAIFLKSKSLQIFGRFRESAQLCKIILDTVEFALPGGVQGIFATDYKLQDTLNKAVELLPELWKLAGAPQEAILSYRCALIYPWNLDITTTSKLEKEFAMFLLYSGNDASPPTLGSQIEGSFVPRNNIEEAILLLLILLSKYAVGEVGWDPSVLDHLSFALCVSGELGTLADEVEKLLPGIMKRRERNYILAFCHYAMEKDIAALNLLRKLLNSEENRDCIQESLIAAKICCKNMVCNYEGIIYVQKALSNWDVRCGQMIGIAYCLLGILLSSQYRLVLSDSERLLRKSQALETLKIANKTMTEQDPYIVFHLCLENAEQRKLDVALHYAKQLLNLEAGSSVKSYILLARIFSAQKRFFDAVTVINAALDQTGKWDQVELLRTKAKLQIAQGQFQNAVKTYINLLAVLQVQSESIGIEKKLLKKKGYDTSKLEMETWHDLANLYTTLSQWRDAEVCLAKSKAISPYSASRWHSTGLLCKAKGLHQEALQSFWKALDVDPTHVPSLVSAACILRQLDSQAVPIVRSLLTDAVRLDRMNPSAWYNLGMVYKGNAGASTIEAAECFEAAALLEESTPVEPFR